MRKRGLIITAMVILLAMAVMCQAAVVQLYTVGRTPSQWTGLSTDSKPTTGAYGSTFYTEDTGVPYVYGVSGWVVDNRRSQLNIRQADGSAPAVGMVPTWSDTASKWLAAAGGGTWGSIIGTLTNQTEFTITPTINKIPIASVTGGKLATGWIPDLSGTYIAIGGNAGTVTNGVYTTGAGTVFQPPASAGGGPVTSSSTPTPAVGTAGAEIRYNITALAEAATFGAPTGTPVEGQVLKIKIKDNATAHTLAWDSGAGGYLAGNQLPLPTTTILSELMILNFIYDSVKAKWLFTGVLGGF